MQSMLKENTNRSSLLKNLLLQEGFDLQNIGLAVIDLQSPQGILFGINMDRFMYPASVYKVFIGAEVLRQVENNILSLEQTTRIAAPNAVETDTVLYPDIRHRTPLCTGDSVTIDTLLYRMLAHSDNTASNTLIDIVGRDNITNNIIHRYHWEGSEITRKFLPRDKEDPGYVYASTTKLCARHAAEFFYLVETKQLISNFVSIKLKEYMLAWKETEVGSMQLPAYASFYRKGGHYEHNFHLSKVTSHYKKTGFGLEFAQSKMWRLFKTIMTKGYAFVRYVNDAGVIEGPHSHYVLAIFSETRHLVSRKQFRLKKLATLIFEYMENQKN